MVRFPFILTPPSDCWLLKLHTRVHQLSHNCVFVRVVFQQNVLVFFWEMRLKWGERDE